MKPSVSILQTKSTPWTWWDRGSHRRAYVSFAVGKLDFREEGYLSIPRQAGFVQRVWTQAGKETVVEVHSNGLLVPAFSGQGEWILYPNDRGIYLCAPLEVTTTGPAKVEVRFLIVNEGA